MNQKQKINKVKTGLNLYRLIEASGKTRIELPNTWNSNLQELFTIGRAVLNYLLLKICSICRFCFMFLLKTSSVHEDVFFFLNR